MFKLFRRFTQFQKFDLGNQFVAKTSNKETKHILTFEESAQAMKEKFGKDYVSPFEKYDLHLPRSSVYGGPKSMEERLHEKNDFKIFRNLFKFIVLSFVVYSGFALTVIKKSAKEAEQDQKQFLLNAVNKQLILESFAEEYQRRKKVSEALKNKS